MKAKTINGDQPATQHDLSLLGGELTRRMEEMEGRLTERIDGVTNNIASLRKVQEATLTVVQSIEGHLKEMADHEERIERLEDAVFKPTARR